MKVKELKKKYKGYDITAFGKPFDIPTIPFTFMPKDKPFEECEIVDIKIEHKEYEQPLFNLNGKLKRTEHMKGKIQIYIK